MVGYENKEYKIFKFLSLIVSSVLKYDMNWIEIKIILSYKNQYD